MTILIGPVLYTNPRIVHDSRDFSHHVIGLNPDDKSIEINDGESI